jgi:hypothetical protein
VAPWYGDGQLTLALLHYRTGDYGKALSLAQRAVDIRKVTAPDAHNIRAMAYLRMNNPDSARKEILLAQQARQAADPSQYIEDRLLRREADSLVVVCRKLMFSARASNPYPPSRVEASNT